MAAITKNLLCLKERLVPFLRSCHLNSKQVIHDQIIDSGNNDTVLQS